MELVYSFIPLALLVGYLWLQWRALTRFAGFWRLAALVPAIAMAAALAVAVIGVMADANLAPLWFFLTLPFACLYLVILSGLKAWLAKA
jgi:hypothetical protein